MLASPGQLRDIKLVNYASQIMRWGWCVLVVHTPSHVVLPVVLSIVVQPVGVAPKPMREPLMEAFAGSIGLLFIVSQEAISFMALVIWLTIWSHSFRAGLRSGHWHSTNQHE